MEEDKFPRNFATLIRYYTDLKRTVKARYPIPGSLTLEQLDKFIAQAGSRISVTKKDSELVIGGEALFGKGRRF